MQAPHWRWASGQVSATGTSGTFEPIDLPWPAIREWIPADDTDPQAVFPEGIVSSYWVPKEIRLDDDRTLMLGPA